MASVTCPNCGKDNPDFLDNCQFCQTALRREATLNTGEGPTKKSTGELEAALPGWLKDARQQARDTAKEDAEKEATKPKIQKAEPPDLLAGLAFQAASEEEDAPDWLAAINPVADKGSLLSSKPAEPESSDFFAQFNQPAGNERELAEEKPVWMQDEEPAPSESDALGGLAEEVPEVSENTLDFGISTQNDADWLDNLSEPAAPQQPAEDLSWLHDLETAGSSKPPAPQADMGWPASDGSSQNDLNWLNNLGGTPIDETALQPGSGSSSQADLSWLDNLGGMPLDQSAASKIPSSSEFPSSQPASSQEDLSWLNNMAGTPAEESPTAQSSSAQEDLSWLNNLGDTPTEESPTAQPSSAQEDLSWLNNFGGTPTEEAPTSQPPSSQEDLSWLNNLGGTPSEETPTSQPVSSQEDLSWLNTLGGTPTEETPASQSPSSQEDLSWLSNLDSTSVEESPASSQEDLGWLNNLGGTSTEQASASQPTSSEEEMSWLNNLGGTSVEEAPVSQPASSQEDMSWLNNLGGTPTDESSITQLESPPSDLGWMSNLEGAPVDETDTSPTVQLQGDLEWMEGLGNEPPLVAKDVPSTPSESAEEPAMPDWFTGANTQSRFSPAHTAPLSDEAVDNTPDWLKSATESASSMPPLNTSESRDWFEAHEQKAVDELQFDSESNQARFDQDQTIQFEEPVSLTSGMPEPVSNDLFSSTGDATLISNEDVDSLFDVDMPDWLSQPAADSAGGQISPEQGNIPASVKDSLAPVDLPSWVQAMRPVESVIESAPVVRADDQPAEREGPLAGLSGVIPLAPVGSAQRPKAVSLKLQASEEQQLTATLLEQIIASETTAHPFRAPTFVASQRTLRWVLTGLFLLILGVVIGLGSRSAQITIPGSVMNEINSMANTIQALPETAPVLVVIDYEPALAGEMEATAGPLLDQIVNARHPKLTFISTSPNGSALSERLLRNTGISQMAEGSQGYLMDSDYFIAGYLSGGVPGVRGFIEQPQGVMPSLQVNLFSDFAAVIVLTDQAESGQTWIEQITLAKQSNAGLASQPLLVVSSAQAGPMLRPYVSSSQVNGMISGLADASRYEFMNNSRPGIARTYWDAFGVGLFLAVISIVVGSLWNIISGFRARSPQADNG